MQIGQVVKKLEPFKGWETKKLMSPGNFSYTLQTLLGNEVFRNRYEMYNTKF